MDDDAQRRIDGAVRDLELRLASFESRLAAIERHAGIESAEHEAPVAEIGSTFGRAELAPTLSCVGRSFVVLGGAFLLRAITDAQIVPHTLGIGAGMTYGLFWLWMAYASPPADRFSAAFHGLVAAVIGYPLLWEAHVRFGVLTPGGVAVGLSAVTAGLFVVALRRGAETFAWIATIAALGTSMALVAATGVLLPFALFLIAFGTATLWIGYAFDWTLLRWPVAAAADFLIVGLTMRVAAKTGGESPLVAVAVQLLLLNAYIVSIAIRTLVRARNVNVFEALQTFAVVTVGLGGAVYVARLTGVGVVPLAVVNLLAGASCYAVAWIFVAKRQGLTRNFHFYTSLGIVLLLVSSRLLLDADAVALMGSVLAVGACAIARRSGRSVLLGHGVVYLLVAAMAAGTLMSAGDALVASAAHQWRPFSATSLGVIAASLACWMIAPRVVFGAILMWTAGGWIVSMVAPALCGVPGAGADTGAVATVRTTILASAALLAAWIAHQPRFRDTVWLMYGVLAAGAVKLVAEDLPHSKPATLFVALAFYGAALIAASRRALPGGGGGSRTRVRRYFPEGLYMHSRF